MGSDLAHNGLLSDGSYLKLATGLGYSAQHSGVCVWGVRCRTGAFQGVHKM